MERCHEVEALLRTMYDAFETGDPSSFEQHLKAGGETLVIGTDPQEWWQGSDDALRALRAQLGEMKEAGIKVKAGDIVGFREGPVAWVQDRAAFVTPAGEVGVRVTGVFLDDGGTWKLVQWHGSVGASNEDVVGTELTT